eukprot:gene12886-15227_t
MRGFGDGAQDAPNIEGTIVRGGECRGAVPSSERVIAISSSANPSYQMSSPDLHPRLSGLNIRDRDEGGTSSGPYSGNAAGKLSELGDEQKSLDAYLTRLCQELASDRDEEKSLRATVEKLEHQMLTSKKQLDSLMARREERQEKASEVIQQSPSTSRLAEIDLGAHEKAQPEAEAAQNEAEKEEEDTWEEREEAGEYDGFNVPTGQREVSLVNHEEEAEFDLASLQTAVDYSETVKNAETEIEGHE